MSARLRAIDALIAERVMGVPRDAVGIEAWACYRREPCTGEWVPSAFSSDPAASKQLRDKMRADGWLYQVTSYPDGFLAGFRRMEHWNFTERLHQSEELAVALAALAALGIEAPQ